MYILVALSEAAREGSDNMAYAYESDLALISIVDAWPRLSQPNSGVCFLLFQSSAICWTDEAGNAAYDVRKPLGKDASVNTTTTVWTWKPRAIR